MTLKELVEEAKRQSPSFKTRIEYWTHERGKLPEFDWLMPQLERILGRDYVLQSANDQIKDYNSWSNSFKRAVKRSADFFRSSLSRTTRRI